MLWLKFLHISGISVWVAGLLYLAALLAGHSRVQDRQDFVRIRMASRFAYMGLISPAAFIAIGAGGALLFVADALYPWMFVKLMAVGVLVIAHVQYGYVLTRLAEHGTGDGPTMRIRIVITAVVASATLVLYLVLAKPDVGTGFVPEWLSEPGLLTRRADPAEALPPPPRLPRS